MLISLHNLLFLAYVAQVSISSYTHIKPVCNWVPHCQRVLAGVIYQSSLLCGKKIQATL